MTAVGWGASSLVSALGIFSKAGKQIKALIDLFKGVATASVAAATAEGAATAATGGLTGAITALKSVAFPIIAIISTIVVGAIALFDKLNVTLDEQKEIVDGLKGKLDELKTEYEQLKSKDDLTDTEEQRLRLLEAEIKANEIILKQEEKKAYSKEFGEESGIGFGDKGYFTTPGNELSMTGVERLNERIKEHAELNKQIEETKNKIIELGQSAGDNSAEISKLEGTLGDLESKDSDLMETLIAGANSLSD